MEKLSIQDQKFVKEVALTGNKTQAAKKAYGIVDENYAAVKGHKQVRKNKIQDAIKSIADQIKDDKLVQVLNEGLDATRPQGVGGMAMTISKGGIDSIGHTDTFVADYAVRHKYLDTALKLKGLYDTDAQNKINVIMPVLVKFIDKPNDRTSDNRDTD